MTDKELLEKAIYWFKVIAEDMERITTGNLSHYAATTKGRAIRAYEFLEKHKEEPVSEDICNQCEAHNDKDKCDELVFGHKCPIVTTSEDLKVAAQEYEQNRKDYDATSDNEIVRRAFKAGAQWQKQIDDNAKRQIHKNAVEYGKSQMLNAACEHLIAHSLLAKPIIDDFRKALEED